MINFIKRLRKSNDATKNFWLWGSTVVSGMVVVVVWAAYLNNRLEAVSYATAAEAAPRPSAAAAFRAGIASVTEQAQWLWRAAQKPRSFTLTDSPRRFIYTDLDPLPPVTLP